MIIQSVIIDDEASNRLNLKRLLERYCADVKIVAEAENGSEGLQKIKEFQPDLIFLDIRMPGMDAFEMLEQIPDIQSEIIFITAYDEYAFRAFAFNALDYLLKPLNFNHLIQAVGKARDKIKLREENQILKNLVNNLQRENGDKRLALPMEEKTEFIAVKDIIRCQADSNYTIFFLLNNKKILVSKTLKEFELALENSGFIRPHNSHLVNTRQIKAFSKRDGGYLEMTDGFQVPISRNRKEEILRVVVSGV